LGVSLRSLPLPSFRAQAKELIDAFKIYLPLFAEVANPAMQGHHWAQVYAMLGVAPEEGAPVTASDLISWGIMAKLEVRQHHWLAWAGRILHKRLRQYMV
jgi:hypothetical protein